MKTFFEQSLGLERSEVIVRSLDAQVEGYGLLDIPVVSRELRPYANGNTLDIGTGNGTFLFKIAEKNPDIQFVGLEHNPDFLSRAQAQLKQVERPNITFRAGFFDTDYIDRHDVICTRFTLQHASNPQAFVQNVHRVLNPGGLFMAVEPLYDYYDSEPADPIWQGFRQRIFLTYERWGSDPNVPKRAGRWLMEAGFVSIRTSIHIYSPITIGLPAFTTVILATATALGFDDPDIWDTAFLEQLESWLENLPCVPYVSIAHTIGLKDASIIRDTPSFR